MMQTPIVQRWQKRKRYPRINISPEVIPPGEEVLFHGVSEDDSDRTQRKKRDQREELAMDYQRDGYLHFTTTASHGFHSRHTDLHKKKNRSLNRNIPDSEEEERTRFGPRSAPIESLHNSAMRNATLSRPELSSPPQPSTDERSINNKAYGSARQKPAIPSSQQSIMSAKRGSARSIRSNRPRASQYSDLLTSSPLSRNSGASESSPKHTMQVCNSDNEFQNSGSHSSYSQPSISGEKLTRANQQFSRTIRAESLILGNSTPAEDSDEDIDSTGRSNFRRRTGFARLLNHAPIMVPAQSTKSSVQSSPTRSPQQRNTVSKSIAGARGTALESAEKNSEGSMFTPTGSNDIVEPVDDEDDVLDDFIVPDDDSMSKESSGTSDIEMSDQPMHIERSISLELGDSTEVQWSGGEEQHLDQHTQPTDSADPDHGMRNPEESRPAVNGVQSPTPPLSTSMYTNSNQPFAIGKTGQRQEPHDATLEDSNREMSQTMNNLQVAGLVATVNASQPEPLAQDPHQDSSWNNPGGLSLAPINAAVSSESANTTRQPSILSNTNNEDDNNNDSSTDKSLSFSSDEVNHDVIPLGHADTTGSPDDYFEDPDFEDEIMPRWQPSDQPDHGQAVPPEEETAILCWEDTNLRARGNLKAEKVLYYCLQPVILENGLVNGFMGVHLKAIKRQLRQGIVKVQKRALEKEHLDDASTIIARSKVIIKMASYLESIERVLALRNHAATCHRSGVRFQKAYDELTKCQAKADLTLFPECEDIDSTYVYRDVTHMMQWDSRYVLNDPDTFYESDVHTDAELVDSPLEQSEEEELHGEVESAMDQDEAEHVVSKSAVESGEEDRGSGGEDTAAQPTLTQDSIEQAGVILSDDGSIHDDASNDGDAEISDPDEDMDEVVLENHAEHEAAELLRSGSEADRGISNGLHLEGYRDLEADKEDTNDDTSDAMSVDDQNTGSQAPENDPGGSQQKGFKGLFARFGQNDGARSPQEDADQELVSEDQVYLDSGCPNAVDIRQEANERDRPLTQEPDALAVEQQLQDELEHAEVVSAQSTQANQNNVAPAKPQQCVDIAQTDGLSTPTHNITRASTISPLRNLANHLDLVQRRSTATSSAASDVQKVKPMLPPVQECIQIESDSESAPVITTETQKDISPTRDPPASAPPAIGVSRRPSLSTESDTAWLSQHVLPTATVQTAELLPISLRNRKATNTQTARSTVGNSPENLTDLPRQSTDEVHHSEDKVLAPLTSDEAFLVAQDDDPVSPGQAKSLVPASNDILLMQTEVEVIDLLDSSDNDPSQLTNQDLPRNGQTTDTSVVKQHSPTSRPAIADTDIPDGAQHTSDVEINGSSIDQLATQTPPPLSPQEAGEDGIRSVEILEEQSTPRHTHDYRIRFSSFSTYRGGGSNRRGGSTISASQPVSLRNSAANSFKHGSQPDPPASLPIRPSTGSQTSISQSSEPGANSSKVRSNTSVMRSKASTPSIQQDAQGQPPVVTDEEEQEALVDGMAFLSDWNTEQEAYLNGS